MDTENLKKFIELAAYLGGGFALAKWIVTDWKNKAQKLDEYKEASIKRSVSELDEMMGSFRYELTAFKDRLLKLEAKFELGVKTVGDKNEKSSEIIEAFGGFVRAANIRFTEIERRQTEVKEIAKDVFRVSSKPENK